MTEENGEPTDRLIICNEEDQFAPLTFFCVYLKEGDIHSLIRIKDISYNEALGLLTTISETLNDFVHGFAENFTDTDEDEDEVKFDKD